MSPHQEMASKARPAPWWLLVLPVFNLVTLLVAIGLIGYLIVAQSDEKKADQPVREQAKQGQEAKKSGDTMKPEVERLKEQIASLSKGIEKNAQRPNDEPRLKAIEDRLTELGKSIADLADRSDAMNKQFASMNTGQTTVTGPRVGAIEERVDELAATLESLRSTLPKIAASPVAEASGNEMDRAIELFKQTKWAEAHNAFGRLELTMPDDARVWYFAGLTNGLSTKDWRGESARLANEGVTREKAGKPDKVLIDAAFADLTAATGKDWLAFFRNRASMASARR
jgi:cell division protein FtsB